MPTTTHPTTPTNATTTSGHAGPDDRGALGFPLLPLASAAAEAASAPDGTRTPVAAVGSPATSRATTSTPRTSGRSRTPYLFERGGWYVFVRRYPRSLACSGLLKQGTCRISLRTRDLELAQRRARALAHRFDEVMLRLAMRQARAPGVSAAAAEGALERAEHPQHQHHHTGPRHDALAEHRATLDLVARLERLHASDNLDATGGSARSGASSLVNSPAFPDRPSAGAQAEPRLDAEGLRRVCAELLHGQLQALHLVLDRLLAKDVGSGPVAPLPPGLAAQGAEQETDGEGEAKLLADGAVTTPLVPGLPDASRPSLPPPLSPSLQPRPSPPPAIPASGPSVAVNGGVPGAGARALAPRDDYDLLDRAFEHWVAKARPRPKTVIELTPVWTRLKKSTGKRRVSELTREDMLTFQSAELSRTRAGRLVRPQTVNKQFALMGAVFTRVCRDVLESRGIANPTRGLTKAAVKGDDYIDKQDFSTEELRQLFGGAVHRGGERPRAGAGEAAYWMPMLGYSLGCRQSELAQVALGEVLQRDGVWCIWLTSRQDERSERAASSADAGPASAGEQDAALKRSMKTGESRRIVPVHPELLRLGFLDYVAYLRKANQTMLFPGIRPDNKGVYAGNWSKWFNRYLGSVGIKRAGLDWVSFRHTMKTAFRSVGIDQDIADYVQGHSSQRTSQTYGRFTPLALFNAMSRIPLPGLSEVGVWTPVATKTPAARPARLLGGRRG